jgi:hypothetical protein
MDLPTKYSSFCKVTLSLHSSRRLPVDHLHNQAADSPGKESGVVSLHPFILFIHSSLTLQPFVGLWSLIHLCNLFTQAVGLLGRGISPSQGS